jgi:hypothetical protein
VTLFFTLVFSAWEAESRRSLRWNEKGRVGEVENRNTRIRSKKALEILEREVEKGGGG